jgi:hypothetical protein
VKKAHVKPLTSNGVPTSVADGCIDAALSGIASETATALVKADLEAIHGIVRSTPGGFAMLNSTVKNHLAKWFEEKGAIRSANRLDHKRLPVTSSHGEHSGEWSVTQQREDAAAGYLDVSEVPKIPVGARCMVGRGEGTVRFVGDVGSSGVRIGVELDRPNGLNDGAARGNRYFTCDPKYGVFVSPDTVVVQPADTAIDADAGTVYGFGI